MLILTRPKHFLAHGQGLSQAAPLRHCANTALQLKFFLTKTAKGTICPLHNLGKKLERKHTRRDFVQYRNYKLTQNMESIYLSQV